VLGFHPILEDEKKVAEGAVSIISHSGTVAGALMARLHRSGVGFGYVVSSGNEATLQAADYMEYLADDDATTTVVLYLEQIRDGDRFRAACQKLRANGKSVVALKAGASENAAQVAFGHTGALVGSHSAFAAAADRFGIAVAQGLEELVALTRVAAPGQRTSRTIVGLSMSGGLCGMLADAADRAGARLAPLDEGTVAQLRQVVPISTPMNPFDLTGVAVDNPGTLGSVLDVLSEGTEASEFVFSLGKMPDATWPDWAGECSRFIKRTGARLSVYAAAGRHVDDGYGFFERAGIPVFESLEPMLRALASLDRAQRPAAGEDSHEHTSETPEPIPADVMGRRELLKKWNLPYVPYAFVGSIEDAVTASAAMGYPVAMKVASEAVAHKAKYGLIALDISSDEQMREEFARLEANFGALRASIADLGALRVEIQKMLPRGGLECFLGGQIDPTFGPLISVGLGGGLVEVIADVTSALAPLTVQGALDLVSSNNALDRALSGSWDRQALAEVVSRFSVMLDALAPVLDEVECNPVIVFEKGACSVDDLWRGKQPRTQ
jgi:acetate---CoA ligase (ADP-forming)